MIMISHLVDVALWVGLVLVVSVVLGGVWAVVTIACGLLESHDEDRAIRARQVDLDEQRRRRRLDSAIELPLRYLRRKD